MRELGLVDPMSVLALDEWEVEREHIVMNRKLGEGAFGMVYGGEMVDEDKQWVRAGVGGSHLDNVSFKGCCRSENTQGGKHC